MKIGIDKIGFYSPEYFLDMADLATARNADVNKYTIGLGQDRMAMPPITQDTITMAANAAVGILSEEDLEAIDLVILGTESGTDQSKAGATAIHHLLGINPYARAIEMKQACYAATAGIQLAKGHIALNPTKKALIIASDISKYGLNSGGEPTQGAGAVAILIAANPRIMSLDNDAAYFTDDILDFWRPNYSNYAFVDGQYSNEQYQRFFEATFNRYMENTGRTLDDFSALTFHIPYTKLGLKSLRMVADIDTRPDLFENFNYATYYNRTVGNIYTGSLYLSLISLLEKGSLAAGSRIGLFSYGSGAVGEFFSGVLEDGYKDHLVSDHQTMIDARKRLSIQAYEAMYNVSLIKDGSHQILDTTHETSPFYLKEIKHHKRIYNK